MKNQFVPYDIALALALKKLGFKDDCLAEWQHLESGCTLVIDEEEDRIFDVPVLSGEIPAPLYQQAFDWFREKYNIHAYILRDEMRSNLYRFIIQHGGEELYGEWRDSNNQANLDCLNQLILINSLN